MVNGGVKIDGGAAARQRLAEGAALLSRAGVESARLDAEVLLAAALGLDKTGLYLRYGARLEPRAEERFRDFLARRSAGEPVAYITGRKEFWSLDFVVTPAALGPRPGTGLIGGAALGVAAAAVQPRVFDPWPGTRAVPLGL